MKKKLENVVGIPIDMSVIIPVLQEVRGGGIM